MMAAFIDITERKQAEEQLKESESKWIAISENSPAHVMLLDKKLNIQFVNRTVPDLSKEEVIGRQMTDFVPISIISSHPIHQICKTIFMGILIMNRLKNWLRNVSIMSC